MIVEGGGKGGAAQGLSDRLNEAAPLTRPVDHSAHARRGFNCPVKAAISITSGLSISFLRYPPFLFEATLPRHATP